MYDLIPRPLRVSILVLTLAAGCSDGDSSDDFVGTWAYSAGMFEIDCGGQKMQIPLGATATETFELGSDRDLSKTDNAGCAGITFDVDGDVASLAPSPQTCMIPNMGTSVAEVYTMTLDADHATLTSHIVGTFTPMGAPSGCALVGGGTLVRAAP